MTAILTLVFLYFLVKYTKVKATEMPETYEERRIWKKYKRGTKEYWVLHKVDGVWDSADNNNQII